VQGLAPGRTHVLAVFVDDELREKVEVEIEPLPEDWTSCRVTYPTDVTQDVICTSGWEGPDGVFACVDRTGAPVWSIQHPGGEALAVVTPLAGGGFAAVGWSKSAVVIFDERGALLKEISHSWLNGQTRFQHDWIDMHELIVIEEGRWKGAFAFLTKTVETIEEEQIYSGGIVVFDRANDEVLWDWQMHGELGDGQPIDTAMSYDRAGQGAASHGSDWDHANALIHRVGDADREEFWVSLRNQDWIIAIDVDTDEILWRLGYEGDFAGGDDTWFYQQHAPEIRVVDEEPHLVLFDNSAIRADGDGGASRVLELAVDEEAMTVELVSELTGFFSPAGGDADVSADGDRLMYVVGVEEPPYIAEVSWPEGELLWRYECELEQMYRADLYPSVYERRPDAQR
jgi:hypothetical protein